MTDEELSEIEERASAATPGPWEKRHDGETATLQILPPGAEDGEFVCVSDYPNSGVTVGDDVDFTFIAASRSDIPALIAEVRRLQGVAASAGREALEEARRKIREKLHALHADGTPCTCAWCVSIETAAASVRGLVGEVGGEGESGESSIP